MTEDACPRATELTSADLLRLAGDLDFQPPGWTVQEIAEFRRLAQCARAARLPTDLLNMLSLRVQRDETHGPNGARATLSSGRVIHLTFNNAVTFEEPKR